MTIKSFRGKIANAAVDTISLHTNNGSTGYRIVKFSIMPEAPTGTSYENVVKIFTIRQTANATMNFSDNTLLAAAFIFQGLQKI